MPWCDPAMKSQGRHLSGTADLWGADKRSAKLIPPIIHRSTSRLPRHQHASSLAPTLFGMSKLSPDLKALISDPAARGGDVPAPSPEITSALFARLGAAPHVGQDTWLCLATAVLFTINSPETLCRLYDHVTQDSDLPTQITVASVSSASLAELTTGHARGRSEVHQLWRCAEGECKASDNGPHPSVGPGSLELCRPASSAADRQQADVRASTTWARCTRT